MDNDSELKEYEFEFNKIISEVTEKCNVKLRD